MVSSARSARPSNHEGVLAALRGEPFGSGPLVRVPREGGDPGQNQKAREAHTIPSQLFWIPAFVGNTADRIRQSAPA